MDQARHRKIAQDVGALIAQRRMAAGLTQEDVAELLGIGNEAVSRLERGVASPSIPRLFEFADIFSCRVEDLLVPASDRGADQSSDIAHHIEQLPAWDRRFVADMVRRMVDHLGQKQKKEARRSGPRTSSGREG
jgi:transcriptional regulator with XRE-family HTH domain